MNDSTRISLAVALAAGLVLPGSAVLGATSHRTQEQRQMQTATRIPILAATDIVDRPVVDRNGHDAGRIDSMVIDTQNGIVKFVVIEGRGNFHLNGRLIAVPWSIIKRPRDRGAIGLTVSAKKLEGAPRISRSALFKLSTLGWSNRVYGYYGRPYPYYGSPAWYGAYRSHYRSHYRYPARAPGAMIPPAPNAKNLATTGSSANGMAPATNGASNTSGAGSNDNGQASKGQASKGLAISRSGIATDLMKVSAVQPGRLRSVVVYSRKADRPLGHVDQVMIDTRTGHVAYALVKRGGFLGLNPTWSAMPVEAFKWTRASPGTPGYGGVQVRPGYRLTVNAKELKGEPTVPVNTNNLTTFAPKHDLAQLYRHFGVKPYWQGKAGRQSTTGAEAQ